MHFKNNEQQQNEPKKLLQKKNPVSTEDNNKNNNTNPKNFFHPFLIRMHDPKKSTEKASPRSLFFNCK